MDVKALIVSSCVSLVSTVVNFTIFLLSYNHLATPYLYEEQRVENTDVIMMVTLPAFAGFSVLVGFLVYIFLRKTS